MSGLFRLPDDLRRLRALFIDLGSESGDPRFIIPLVFGELNGLQWRRVRPGGDLERPTLPIPWMVMVDDRAAGALGPTSFDAGTLQWLFADAFKIAIDAAEPQMELYEYFVEEGLKRSRILIVQTVESRENSRHTPRRVVPIRNDPDRCRAYVTRFEGRSAPRR